MYGIRENLPLKYWLSEQSVLVEKEKIRNRVITSFGEAVMVNN